MNQYNKDTIRLEFAKEQLKYWQDQIAELGESLRELYCKSCGIKLAKKGFGYCAKCYKVHYQGNFETSNPQFRCETKKDGQLYFSLTAKNGQIILSSEGYKSKAGLENGIESVRKNSQIDDRFIKIIKIIRKLLHFFLLTAANGEIIGKSKMYTTNAAMENGIESVKKYAPNAQISYE
jgi:uncharacterized protein YegP (UPF0339 family)